MLENLKKLLLRRSAARAPHLALGERGEREALAYLKDFEGFDIVATNFRVALGRGLRGRKLTAEIDIIAYDGETLAFIEVKTRASDEVVAPERAVDLRKQRQIARAAHRYRRLMRVTGEAYRYDVVTVVPDGRSEPIELLRNYFDDRVFQKGRYFKDMT
ncbi:MAG TPA: YraN family protein [Blastocatellia bacterium]|jgi:putative endonuclease|nr:YraN family protein [Blastocatellia bacterium]